MTLVPPIRYYNWVTDTRVSDNGTTVTVPKVSKNINEWSIYFGGPTKCRASSIFLSKNKWKVTFTSYTGGGSIDWVMINNNQTNIGKYTWPKAVLGMQSVSGSYNETTIMIPRTGNSFNPLLGAVPSNYFITSSISEDHQFYIVKIEPTIPQVYGFPLSYVIGY